MIGTLESLVRGKPGTTLQQEAPAAPQAAAGDLAPRVDALETQVGAIAQQLERIGQQLTRIETRLDGAAPQSISPQPEGDQQQDLPPLRQGQAPGDPSDTASIYGDTSKPRWFGPRPGGEGTATQGEPESPQTLMTALPTPAAQALYQQAYGAFLQADYPAAEQGFRQFLASYPKDALAGNAQYWLGESYYARGDYKNAADAYLKGYKTYKTGDKAPDALLKLGLSLAALGQKDAACSTFGELEAKFPNAPEDVRDQAHDERLKAGC
jgi:tol-pal system protein YbgF